MRLQSWRDWRMPTVLAVLLLLALAFIFRSSDPSPVQGESGWALRGLIAPGGALGEWVAGWRGSEDAVDEGALRDMRERLAELQTELALKDEELAAWRLGAQQTRGGSTLDVPAHFVFLAADVVGCQPQPRRQSVTLNRGARNGVRRDMPVVSDLGLVGIVREVEERTCLVQLVTDPYFVVSVQGEGGVWRGVVLGEGAGEPLRLELEAPRGDLVDGMEVKTSGLSGSLYPRGLPVGRLRIGERDSRGLEALEVEPAAALEAGFVLILQEW